MVNESTHEKVSAEELASHSIRANHEVINDILRAKEAIEEINEEMPDIFAILTEQGQVVRGNRAFAKVVECDEESVYETNFKELFLEESWAMIQRMLQSTGGKTERNSFTIEMPIDRKNPNRLFYWTFSRFVSVSDRRGRIYSVIGRDISELRAFQVKLANIFAAIPLGVLTINSDAVIEAPYSSYTELLLESESLDGLKAEECLYGSGQKFMTVSQIEGMKVFFNHIGVEEEWYDMAKGNFPTEIPFVAHDSLEPSKWLGLTYNPIVRSGKVEKILVVVDDITERVRQRQQFAARLSKEQKLAQLIFDLQDAEPYVLESCLEDLEIYVKSFRQSVAKGETVREICNALHGIKGVARMVNLRSFKEFSHEMESRLLRNAAQIEADPHNRMKSEMALFNFEWEELRKYMELFKVSEGEGKNSATEITEQKPDDLSLLSKRQELMKLIEGLKNEDAWHSSHLLESLRNEVFAIGRVPLTTMEDKLKMFVNTTRKKLNKNLEIQFKWNDSVIELEKRTSLLEILYHLMNNAVDHGIESPAEREKAGKPGTATIKVEAHAEQGQLEIVVTDDGAGIRREKLMEKAVESGMCKNLDEAEKMETIKFLTASGVSTAENLTDISGRGIGLDAVDGKIKKLGGDGLLLESTTVGVGTTFRFVINA